MAKKLDAITLQQQSAAADTVRLQSRAMLVELHISAWNGRKTDKAATSELLQAKGCGSRAASVVKMLVDKIYLQPIAQVSTEMRATHRNLTLPWDDSGRRLLPVDIYDRYRQEIEALINVREKAVERFIAEYSEAIHSAKRALGDLFDKDDYPRAEDIRGEFSADYEISPVPEKQHFVANVGESEADRIKASVERRMGKRLQDASRDIYQRLHDAITTTAKAIERADDKGKRIHGSLLDTLRGLCETLPLLDINDDREIRKMCSDLRKLLDGVSVDELRPKSKQYAPAKRAAVEGKLTAMSAAMAGYVGPKGSTGKAGA